MPSAINRSNACSECGVTNKFGKRSCCARGGAWFKNCGDTGDTNFEHTWTEGVQACKGIAPSISIDSPVQVFRQHVKGDGYPLNTTRLRNVTQSRTISSGYMYRDIPDASSSIRDFGTHAEINVYICILTAIAFCICVVISQDPQ